MSFETIPVSRKGLEYYIGEIEDFVKSEYNALKGNPDELRSQIRDPNHLKYGDISETRENIESAERAVRDEATANGWGITNFTDTQQVIKLTEKPTTEPEEHPSAKEQPTTAFTIKYKAYADVYASFFFKEGVELFRDLAAWLAGKPVHFDNTLAEVLMLRTVRNISKGSESIGAGLLPDQELALKREQTIKSHLKEHTDYETRRTSEESLSAVDKDEYELLAERVLHMTVWGGLKEVTNEKVQEAAQEARRIAYTLIPGAFSDRNEFDSSLKGIDTGQHITDFQKMHMTKAHLLGELEPYTRGESEEVTADINDLIGKEVEKTSKFKKGIFDSAGNTRKILEAVDKSLDAIRESVISKYYINPEDRKKEDPAADKKRLARGIIYKVWDKLYGEKISQIMMGKGPADDDLSRAYEATKRKANALMPGGELEGKFDLKQHRKDFMATFLTKLYLEGQLEGVKPRVYGKRVEAEVDKIIKLKQDIFISADDPRKISEAVDKSLESIRKDTISKYINPEHRKDPAADYKTLSERVLHKTIWAGLPEDPTDEVLIKAYKEAGRMAYALIPGAFKDREEFEASLKAEEGSVEQHKEDFRKMHLTEAYLLRELGPYTRGESEEVTADIKDLVGEQVKGISRFRDALFSLPGNTKEVLREVDKSLESIRKDIISKYYIKQGDLPTTDKKTLAERILHREWDKLYQKAKDKGLSDDDFSRAYEAARRKANALMPDGELEGKIDLKQHKRDFVAMFLPKSYLEKQLKGARPHLYEEFVEAEVDEITSLRQKVFDSLGDTGEILYKVEKSLEAIKGKALTTLLGEEYNGSEEHKKRAAAAVKYSILAELGERVRERVDKANEEIDALMEEKEELEGKLGEVGVVGDETDQKYGARLGEIEEKIKKAQLKSPVGPTNEEYKSAIQAIITETKIFLGATYPIDVKDLAVTLKSDYRRQNNTFDAVCDIIAPLYVGIKIEEEGGKQDQYRTTPGKPTDEEKDLVMGIISGFKSKPGNYMTKEALQELMGPIGIELQKFHLGSKRCERYENLKDALGDKQLAEEIADPDKSIGKTKFDYLAQATFRYFLAGNITKEEATATLDRLRCEELADEFFSRVCKDLDLKLSTEAGERDPSKEELEAAYKIAVAKARVVMPAFASRIETRYQKGADRELTKKGEGLEYDYLETYKPRTITAGVQGIQEFLNYAFPKKMVELWEKIGDERPSPEEFYEAYKEALRFSFELRPDLYGSAPTKEGFDIWLKQQEEPTNKRTFRKERLPAYMSTIRDHKKQLERQYQIAPGWAIEEHHTPSLFTKHFPTVFFRV